MPRQKEMKDSLANAVDKHGGLNRLAMQLGRTAVKRTNRWWRKEDVVVAAIQAEAIPVVGHFPTAQELRDLGRYDLANAISRGGGFRHFRRRFEESET